MRGVRLCATQIRCWSNVTQMPPDPILGLSEAFKLDPNPNKMNLTIGAYRDDNGLPFVLQSVRKAEKILSGQSLNKEYPPLTGVPEFCSSAAALSFGMDSPIIKNKLNCTVQTASGAGGLRLGSEFLMRNWPGKKEIWIPNPTWANHNGILSKVEMEIKGYRYYDTQTKGLDYSGLMTDFEALEDKSLVLLHACAHNPTGVDPTVDQWKSILDLLAKKRCGVFFDMAYQGYATGDVDKDAFPIRYMANSAHSPILLVQSFSKNMGLYGERTACLTVVCQSQDEKSRVISHLHFLARRLWSFSPIHGARIAGTILNDPELKAEWLKEVEMMANRIFSLRKLVVNKLAEAGSRTDWSHIQRQIGMFCYSGLDKDQVGTLRTKYSIYMTNDGRISITGLNSGNIEYFVRAVHDVTN